MIKKSCMKKAQAQIITTILIILLVLAAMVIVWQVVNKSIKDSSDQIIAGVSCTNLNVIVSEADSSTETVLITRNPGASGTNVTGLVLYVNGEKVKEEPESLEELGTYIFSSIPLVAGDKVQVATKIGENACPLSAETIAVDGGGTPPACVPDCSGKECGNDGCGGSCGACSVSYECDEGTCVEICVPETCESFGYECGDDGCGGNCLPGCQIGYECSGGSCIAR